MKCVGAAEPLASRYLAMVMRHPTRINRLLRSLTALVTVWCLGCNAFDPLISSLVPGSAGGMMMCAGESSVPAASASALADDGVSSVSALASDRDAHDGVACDCQSCHAPAPTALALVPPPMSLPQEPSADPAAPPGAEPPPLVPPPQRSA
jgi:hypothetical protein